MKKIIKLIKQGRFWTALTSFFLLLLGISGAMLAASGVCIFCVIPILGVILSLVGLNITILADYNIFFIVLGVVSLALTIFLFIKKKKCKDGTCF